MQNKETLNSYKTESRLGENEDLANTIKTLRAYADNLRPDPADFRNVRAFKRSQIDEDLREVKKNTAFFKERAKIDLSDSTIGHAAEDMLFLALNQHAIVKEQENFEAIPSSYFDDQKNGVDLICRLPRAHRPELIFSLDVTTASTPQTVSKKFEQSQITPDDSPRWCSPIRYYQSGRSKYSLQDVPHFIIGFSSDSCLEALEKIQPDRAGGLVFDENPDLRFKILTEIFEQSLHYITSLNLSKNSGSPQKRQACESAQNNFTSINRLAALELASLLGLQDFSLKDPDYPQKLGKAYQPKSNTLCETDPAYANIIGENRRLWRQDAVLLNAIKKQRLGQKTHKLGHQLAREA